MNIRSSQTEHEELWETIYEYQSIDPSKLDPRNFGQIAKQMTGSKR